jgi:hypothetical protein
MKTVRLSDRAQPEPSAVQLTDNAQTSVLQPSIEHTSGAMPSAPRPSVRLAWHETPLREQVPPVAPVQKRELYPLSSADGPAPLPFPLPLPTRDAVDGDSGLLAALAVLEHAVANSPALGAPTLGATPQRENSNPGPVRDARRGNDVARLPATWYAEPKPEPERRWSAEVKAGVIGLGIGLSLVLPMGLYASGWLGARAVGVSAVSVAPTEGTLATGSLVSSFVDTTRSEAVVSVKTVPVLAHAAAVSTPLTVEPATRSTRIVAEPSVLIAEARRAMTTGDIETARLLLAHPAARGEGEAMLLLGETFDPNVLAALGTRGVVADVARARSLYQDASRTGLLAAATRLRGLN